LASIQNQPVITPCGSSAWASAAAEVDTPVPERKALDYHPAPCSPLAIARRLSYISNRPREGRCKLHNDPFSLDPIGAVESPLRSRKDAPRQPFHDAPEAWLVIEPRFIKALDGIAPGTEILVFTWLHQAKRETLTVHAVHDPKNPLAGVFATRSPDRPNPIGLHRVKVLEVRNRRRLKVDHLEAIHGTPIIDIKPILDHPRAQ
jgi:tRNA-Thr(GGU) m(6)t(6)A37 methyltransferase TsaA